MHLTQINEIRELLDRHGFRFSKSMGQNFLTAAWVPERIADSAELDGETLVLEVGPGIGCLTEQLSLRAGKVVSVELDNALRPVLAETMQDRDNVEIVFGDVLKQDLPELVRTRMAGMKRAVVCANLPYNVTSPLITAFIEAGCFDTVTVMIQREVARRICAGPGAEDYGAFGIYVQWHYEAELLFDVSPGCFVPQPKVTSSVIRLKKRTEKPCRVQNEELMMRLVRAAFNQRRKTLVNSLSAGTGFDKSAVEQALQAVNVDPRVRGEAIGIGTFALIADELNRRIST